MPNVDDVISAYVKMRDKKEAIEAATKEKTSAIKAQLDKLEAWLIDQAQAQGVTSFKTKHGTAFLATTDFASVGNWDEVLSFIREHEAYEMLERRVSKKAVRSYIDEHKSVPNGVNYGTRLDVQVRRPAPSVEA
jgi:hypothetical protein